MKKTQFILVFIYFVTSGFSQTETGKHFVLNQNLTGQNKTYIARDYIKLTGDFRYIYYPRLLRPFSVDL